MFRVKQLFISGIIMLGAAHALQAGVVGATYINLHAKNPLSAGNIANSDLAEALTCPQDTTTYYYWSDSGTWQPARRNIITHASATTYTDYRSQQWANGNWQNIAHFAVTYNTNNMVETELREEWSNTVLTTSRYRYAYDAAQNNTLFVAERLTAGTWVPLGMDTFIYDAGNNITVSLSKQWVSGAWVNRYKVTNTYNSSNHRIGYLLEQWNGSSWQNESRNTYNVNATGAVVSDVYEEWISGAWVIVNRYNYNYDVSNNLTTYATEQWNGTGWVNKWLYTYGYDAANNKTTTLVQEWNNANWLNMYRDTMAYNAANQLTYSLNQKWVNGAWQSEQEKENTYNPAGNRVYGTHTTWTNGVMAKTRITLTYNGSGQLLYSVAEMLQNGSWVNAERVVVGCAVSTDINQPDESTLTGVYPNPSQGQVTLAVFGTSAFCHIKVFDVAGSLVYSSNEGAVYGNANFTLNLQHLTTSIYTLQVYTDGTMSSHKLVLSK
jgi:hypothetical protein